LKKTNKVVYFIPTAVSAIIVNYKNKNIEISKIKLGKRDAKGTKLRV